MKSSATLLALCLAVAAPCQAADLFDPSTYQAMTSDKRALRTGDALTVLVYEDSSASSTADTSTNTSAGLRTDFSRTNGARNGFQAGVGDDYGGRGGEDRIQRSGRLLAQLSVPVQEVLPNGDLVVAGEQRIDVNGEKTNIKLKGRVRPQDIASNNTVLSSRLADVSIEYIGDGYLSDRSRPGLIPRVLAWLGLW